MLPLIYNSYRVASGTGKDGKQGIFRKNAGKTGNVYGSWQWEAGKAGFFFKNK